MVIYCSHVAAECVAICCHSLKVCESFIGAKTIDMGEDGLSNTWLGYFGLHGRKEKDKSVGR